MNEWTQIPPIAAERLYDVGLLLAGAGSSLVEVDEQLDQPNGQACMK